LCSDGLSDLVNNKDITTILLSHTSLEEKGRALIEAANNAGGKDNITAVMVQNDAKPAKQKATKPIVLKKKEIPEPVEEKQVRPVTQNAVPTIAKAPGKKGLIIFLSVLSLLLAAALIWLLFFRDSNGINNNALLPVSAQPNEQETLLRNSLGPISENLLVLSDSVFKQPIVLTDSLIISKDSLHIRGDGHIVFVRDSSFAGPAFFISSTCKNVLLENIKLEGFDLGIVSSSKSIRLKNVQFVHCRVPLQYQQQFPDNAFISGGLSDNFIVKTDSLVLKTSSN
jgi:hypothetical protein